MKKLLVILALVVLIGGCIEDEHNEEESFLSQPEKVFACEKQIVKWYLFKPKKDITAYELAMMFSLTHWKLRDASGDVDNYPEGVKRHFVEEER